MLRPRFADLLSAGLSPGCLLVALILACCLAPGPASAQLGQRGVANNVRIKYVPPKNAAHKELYETLTGAKALEYLQQMLSPLRLPRPLQLTISECDGVANAWYADGAVTVCYELIQELVKDSRDGPPPEGLDQRDTVIGPLMHIVLHEVGHAVFDLLQVPLFGREEDAADQFAAYLMLQFDPPRARKLMIGTAYQYRLDMKDNEVTLPKLVFSEEHGLPQQRFYNTLCLAYGSDAKTFAAVRERNFLPKDRLEACESEYRQVEYAFQKLIGPHVDRRLADKVRRALVQGGQARR